MKLAANVVHTLDVDAMLDSMTHEQFAEWCAFDSIEPIGTDAVCRVLANLGIFLAGTNGHKIDAKWFMPWAEETSDHQAGFISPEKQAAFFRGLTGG